MWFVLGVVYAAGFIATTLLMHLAPIGNAFNRRSQAEEDKDTFFAFLCSAVWPFAVFATVVLALAMGLLVTYSKLTKPLRWLRRTRRSTR